MTKRVPKVGDWIKRATWREFRQVSGLDERSYIVWIRHIYDDSGSDPWALNPCGSDPWLFRDPLPVALDLTKLVQTRDGRPVRILCTDVKGPRPIVGAFSDFDGAASSGHEFSYSWLPNGYMYSTGPNCNDLVNVPTQPRVHTEEVVLYLTSEGNIRMLQARNCKSAFSQNRVIARKLITLTEGEGLA